MYFTASLNTYFIIHSFNRYNILIMIVIHFLNTTKNIIKIMQIINQICWTLNTIIQIKILLGVTHVISTNGECHAVNNLQLVGTHTVSLI